MVCTVKKNTIKNDKPRYTACDMPTESLKLEAVRLTRLTRKNLMSRKSRMSLKRRGTLEKPTASLIIGDMYWNGMEEMRSVRKEVFK